MGDDHGHLPPLPSFSPEERVCGNCKLWHAHSVDARGWVGPCRLQPQRGLFPPSAPICDAFVAKGSLVETKVVAAPAVRVARATAVAVRRRAPSGDVSSVSNASGRVAAQPQPAVTLSLEGEDAMTREEWMKMFREAMAESTEVPDLASKWQGGTLQLIPGNPQLQAKEIPIDSLFHKVVMVRDRLRTLEQRINAHAKLSDAEKVEIQQYITRVYGSLTSFNLLFQDRADYFVGTKSEE